MDRRQFLKSTMAQVSWGGVIVGSQTCGQEAQAAAPPSNGPIIDTHMHVWAKDAERYPFPHPYVKDFRLPEHEGTLEMLMADMDAHGCTHAVLVQVIYHGWDNTYIADCVRRYPTRLRAHGLIDPTDPHVADKLEYWTKEHGLGGMRFSPIYYRHGEHGGDAWLAADETHRLWQTAERLGSVFNFFISTSQLPALGRMVAKHPDVRVIVDHLGQMDLGAADAEEQLRLLLAIARYPNVWVKVSELSSVSKSHAYPFSDAYPTVKRVYEAFGPDRLLFGTGYPGAARAAFQRPTLDAEIALISVKMPFFTDEDRTKILGRNAAALWGFRAV